MTIEVDAATWVKLHGHRAPQRVVDALVQAIKAHDEPRILELDGLSRAVDAVLAGGQDAAESGLENPPSRINSAGS